MSDRYTTCYRVTYYLTRAIIFGLLNVLLACLADVGCQGSEEILSSFSQEQRDCEKVHHYVTGGAWKLFCTALAFVLVSRYNKFSKIKLPVIKNENNIGTYN